MIYYTIPCAIYVFYVEIDGARYSFKVEMYEKIER